MRKGVAAVGLCLLLCPAPARAAQTVVPMERNQVATCVRDAGSGQLQLQAPLTDKTTPTDLLTASPEQVQRAAGTDLGSLLACPEAASGGGVTVIAGFSSPAPFERISLRAAVRGDLAAFEEPALLDTVTRSEPAHPAVAVGPRGDAVVAWQEERGDVGDEVQQVRVLAARRPAGPGARFGAVEQIVPWSAQSEPDFGTKDVAAGVDGEGRTTVAWAVGAPPSRRISSLSSVGVSSAAPGEPFRRVRLRRQLQDVSGLSLAVAPDGAALLATTGEDQVHLFERPAGGAFAEAPAMGGEEQSAEEAAVDLDPSGAAVVAWRYTGFADEDARTGVQVARRVPGGDFAAPVAVWSRRRSDEDSLSAFIVGEGEASPPLDARHVRAAVTADGRAQVTWIESRRVDGDRLPAGYVATSDTAGRFVTHSLGSPCRPVNGLTPFTPAAGRLATAWTDNAAQRLDDEIEFPLRSGRLHVGDAPPQRPAAAAPQPALTLPRSRGTQRLWSDQALRVPVECASACDLRAYVPGHDGPARASGATLTAAGRGTVPLYAGIDRTIGRKPRDIQVVVRACSPDGTSTTSATTKVRAVRRPAPRVPKPVHVRARRSGDAVVVTWRTEFPARRTQFVVYGQKTPDENSSLAAEPEFVDGAGRTRFRARLEAAHVERVRYVTVYAASTESGRKALETTVAVSR